jgi:hypothetical protein
VLPLEDAALDGLVEDVPAVPAGFVAVVPAVVPAVVLVPAEEPDDPDVDAFVRMKLASVELAEPVVPEVPVAPDVAEEPRWTHPVTVT